MASSIRAATTRTASFSILSSRDFRWFTLAGMLWMMADNIEHVISYWVIHEKFASPMLGGFAVISHWTPFLLGGMYFGALADRHDLRKLFMISMSMFMAVSLGWSYIFWTDTAEIWHSVVLLTVHGLAGALFSPASQLMLHDLVSNQQLPSAVRLTATSRQMGLMLGPALGGFLLLGLGPAPGLLVNACFYLPMVWWSLRASHTGHGDADLTVLSKKGSLAGFSTVLDTVKEASNSPAILSMIVLVGLTSGLIGNGFQPQLPQIATAYLGGASGGLLYASMLLATAIGAIFGGLVQEGLPWFTPHPTKAVLLGAGWAASMAVFAAAPHYAIALAALFVSGMLLISFTAMAQSLVQLEAPPASRGRMVGLFNTSLNGLRIGGGFTIGFLGAAIGVQWAIGLSAAVLFLSLMPLLHYLRMK